MRWLIKLHTSFQECNKAQHTTCITLKPIYFSKSWRNTTIKSWSVNYFYSEKLCGLNGFIVRFGWNFTTWKNRIVWTGTKEMVYKQFASHLLRTSSCWFCWQAQRMFSVQLYHGSCIWCVLFCLRLWSVKVITDM